MRPIVTPDSLGINIHSNTQQRLITWRQLTQVQIPAEALDTFRQSISQDLSFVADINAAIVELSSQIQFRTEVLADAMGSAGQAVGNMQRSKSGYGWRWRNFTL